MWTVAVVLLIYIRTKESRPAALYAFSEVAADWLELVVPACSALFDHPMTALTVCWSRIAASRHTGCVR